MTIKLRAIAPSHALHCHLHRHVANIDAPSAGMSHEERRILYACDARGTRQVEPCNAEEENRTPHEKNLKVKLRLGFVYLSFAFLTTALSSRTVHYYNYRL